MNEEILKAIEKSLPSLQAKELKGFFERYEESENTIKTQSEIIGNLEDTLYDLKEKEKSFKNAEDLFKASEVNKIEIEKLTQSYEVKKLTDQLINEKQSTDKLFGLVATIFKNRYITKSICSSGNIGNEANGGYENKNITETVYEQEMN